MKPGRDRSKVRMNEWRFDGDSNETTSFLIAERLFVMIALHLDLCRG
jgi:hypothetical protein